MRPPRPIVAAKDPNDNKFLECVDAARADARFWKKTKAITSRGFIDIVAPHLIP